MATQAQIEANRRNAQKSTGPKTPQGKHRSSRNATRLGIYSRDLLLPGEEPVELEILRQQVHDRFDPRDAAEVVYVERFVASSWRLKRALAGETRVLARWQRNSGFVDPSDVFSDAEGARQLDKLQRHIASLERSMDRALAELRRLRKAQNERQNQPAEQPEQANQRTETVPGEHQPRRQVALQNEQIEADCVPDETCAIAAPGPVTPTAGPGAEDHCFRDIQIVESNPIPAVQPPPQTQNAASDRGPGDWSAGDPLADRQPVESTSKS